MKKAILFLLNVAILSLGGCKSSEEATSSVFTSTSKKEPVIYEPEYTITKEYIGTTTDSNNSMFNVENVEQHDSILEDKVIYFLGSSVTYGANSDGKAMGEYLAALTGCTIKKEAVSGTTIQNESGKTNSYTQRLENTTEFDVNAKIDAFVCQISTNDAYNSTRLGRLGRLSAEDQLDSDSFDRNTTYGGLEFIVTYVTETWGCPVFFYSGAYFGDGSGTRKSSAPTGSNYKKIIDATYDVAEKYNSYQDFEVFIIDLFNDEDFNDAADDEYYKWATNDPVHPKKAGYLQWWTPYFEAYLSNYFEGNLSV